MTDDKAHAKFSASGADRWLNCPGSIALAEKAPPARESNYALEGTQAHDCLEFFLKNRTERDRALKTALRRYDTDMIEHALAAAEWIEDRLLQSPDAELLCETKVNSSPFTCDGQFGTLDAAVVQEFGCLTVVDYKYGAGIAVDPEGRDGRGNPQLVYYALALSHQYRHNFSEVELVIIQPRAYHHSGQTVRTVRLAISELLSWQPLFKAGVQAALEDGAVDHLKAGPWCKFCSAAPICPEIKNKALRQAQVVFDDLSGLQSVPEPKLIQLPNLGTILDACERLEDWISKVRDHAEHVLDRGEKIEGFKLVNKKSPRRWLDEEKAADEALKVFGPKALTEPKLLSPAGLEKAAKGATGLDAWIAQRVTDKSSGTTLVRETDKRPAVSAGNVFPALPSVLQGKLPVVKSRKSRNGGQ